jgi:hypothetical protein
MPTNSLGYRNEVTVRSSSSLPAPATQSTPVAPCAIPVLRGFIPLMFYAAFSITVPLLAYYSTVGADLVTAAASDDDASRAEGARALWISISVIAASFIVLSNHCATWYNMVLFFHIGLEVKVLHEVINYALTDSLATTNVALSWTGAAIVMIHLIPFLLVDSKYLLATLAWAGVGVNVALTEYIFPSNTLTILLSSTSLLVATLATLGADCYQPSIVSQFQTAMAENSFIRVERYTL